MQQLACFFVHHKWRSRMASLPSTKPRPAGDHLTAYRLPATPLSVAWGVQHSQVSCSIRKGVDQLLSRCASAGEHAVSLR